jgi:hypothetical protein
MTCTRTQGFLAKKKVSAAEVVNASKARLGPKDALALLDGMDTLWAMKGRKVVQVDLRQDRPPAAGLLALLLGPTGNLRAPTLRAGRTLIVGFDEATYSRLFR